MIRQIFSLESTQNQRGKQTKSFILQLSIVAVGIELGNIEL